MLEDVLVKALVVFVVTPAVMFACAKAVRWYSLHSRERAVVAGIAMTFPPLSLAVAIFYGLWGGAELAGLFRVHPLLVSLISVIFAVVSIAANVFALLAGLGKLD